MSCPLHDDSVVPVFRSQAYWDFIIGGILAWDGQLQPTRRYTWDLNAELTRSEQWMRDKVASFPSLSYAERRQIAVDVVRTTAFTGPDVAWKNDRLCPFTGNALMTLKAELLYPQSTLDTIDADAIGTAAPLATPLLRAIVDDILEEGGWRISDREDLECATASVHIDRDEWVTNPYWDDVRTWQIEHLSTPGDPPYAADGNEAAELCEDFENPFACEHEHSSGLYCLWEEQNGLFGECVDAGFQAEHLTVMLIVAAILIALSTVCRLVSTRRTKKSGTATSDANAAPDGMSEEGGKSTVVVDAVGTGSNP